MKILADWGTSNLRAWLVDESGQVVSRHTSDRGLMEASQTGFHQAFEEVVDALGAAPDTAALLFGMVGSQKGWLEVPYASTPADADAIARCARPVPDRPSTWVVGGVSHGFDGPSPEVMRGEEVQSLGVMVQRPDAQWVCLPGTHTKWVHVSAGRIVSFKTYMTGELFNLVTKHSIISTQIEGEGFDREGFERGLELAKEGGALSGLLFQLRTRYLAGSVGPRQVSAMSSGLLIGHELVALPPPAGIELVICASTALAEPYRLACASFGLDCVLVDPEQAALDGLLAIAPLIEYA